MFVFQGGFPLRENVIESFQSSATASASAYSLPGSQSVAGQQDASAQEGSSKNLGRVRNRPAREQALLEAGTRLFATRGYEATTTREIAAEAGCAEGLIHRYFQGKEGLLFAIIRSRSSAASNDSVAGARPVASLSQEIVELTESELERIWEDREFFRVLMPRAFLDSNLGHVLNRVGPLRRATHIRERLKAASKDRPMSDHDIEALTHFIGTTAFMFGFVRPVVLGEDRTRSRAIALATAEMFARGM
jgi:TetR/AcrR family transcriptional regulator, regulator of cefoperazone and chloramphenicol sensitivity